MAVGCVACRISALVAVTDGRVFSLRGSKDAEWIMLSERLILCFHYWP